MRFFKKLATLFATLTLCLGLGVAATACNDKKDSSTDGSAEGYNFLVLDADENPTDDYKIQLCFTSGACLSGYATPDAEGKAFFEVANKSESYVIHLWRVSDDSKVDDLDFIASGVGANNTIAANHPTDSVITITLSANAE